MHNLHVVSGEGRVDMDLTLVSDSPCKSYIHAESHDSKVVVKILSRKNQRFSLTAKSNEGAVTVCIPPDFQGPISYTIRDGHALLSDRIKQHMTPFSTVSGTRRAFIGDWSSSGYGEDSKVEWQGDELVVSTDEGDIKLFYADEPIKLSERSRMSKDLRNYGVFGGIARTVSRNIVELTNGIIVPAMSREPSETKD